MLKWAVYLTCAVLSATLFLTGPLGAAIYSTGDVDPADPSTWDSGTDALIGETGTGSVTADGSSDLVSRYGYIGVRSGSTGEVTIDGNGSTWNNSGRLDVGYQGNGNLNITGGGAVSCRDSYIGYKPGTTGEVTVDGAGSTWNNSGKLILGVKGDGTLNIINGGNVIIGKDTRVDCTSESSGTIHFDDGTLNTSGLCCAGNDITGTGIINTNSLISDVDLVFDATHGLNQTLIMNNNNSQNITINLDFDGSGSLGIGHSGVGTMSISDGMVVESANGNIGYQSGSTGEVTVSGAGSTWTNDHWLYVGQEGNGTLTVTEGGTIECNRDTFIAYNIGSTGEVTVDGTGSTWNNSGSIYVGSSGKGRLTITDAGVVNSRSGSISSCFGLTSEVIVDGAGSTWNNTSSVGISNGKLNIIGSGRVNTGNGYIGYSSASTGEVTVDGTGSIWNNAGMLYVGRLGNGTLNITGGGIVDSNKYTYIGLDSASTGEVTVDGAGSTWTNSSKLHIGFAGRGILNITDGGNVTVEADTFVASHSDSSGRIHFDNGTLTAGGLCCASDDLTGTGTINTHGLVSDVDLIFDATHGLNQIFAMNKNGGHNITINLDVDGSGSMGAGHSGSGTTSISDGIVVESTDGYIGYKSGSTGEMTVDGAGSVWSSSHWLNVGYAGNGKLMITDGGVVSSGRSHIGRVSGSTGEVTVDGTGSIWNSDSLFVGCEGIGKLNVIAGGTVSNGGSHIGCRCGSTGEATVAGAGSTWTNSSSLYVGFMDNGTLTITDGGTVISSGGTIGLHSTGEVTVEGIESTWANSGELFVGKEGDGSLKITEGGVVSVGSTLTIDWNNDGDSFINMATGGMLALFGNADDSIDEFLGLVEGTDAIRYWDDSLPNWALITDATAGEDYWLEYLTTGDLAGYTMLTVGVVPEPGAVVLILVGLGTLLAVRRRR